MVGPKIKVWMLLLMTLSANYAFGNQKIFMSGGKETAGIVKTLWPNKTGHWWITGATGTLATGNFQTDERGNTSIVFAAPKVRTSTRLALTMKAQTKETRTFELMLLPEKPFSDFVKTINKLKIGVLDDGHTISALKQNEIKFTSLDLDIVRGNFNGNVIILNENSKQTREWINSLPKETCIVIINDNLSQAKNPVGQKLFTEERNIIWNELPADWLDLTGSKDKLPNVKGMTVLKMLACSFDTDGDAYPLIFEMSDFYHHHWLIWNLPNMPTQTDPRLEFDFTK